jgi:Cu/Ag efflux pump CusA
MLLPSLRVLPGLKMSKGSSSFKYSAVTLFIISISRGAHLRLILMTAFAFILGVVPLVFASGAGANSRHSLGTAVFGGMIVSTFLSLIVVPVFYVLIEKLRERRIEKQRSST